MLSGDNSILNQAGRARDITGEKSITERVQIAYLGALATGTGSFDRGKFVDELDNTFGAGKYTLSTDGSTITIDGKDYYFDGTVTPGGSGGETQTVEELRTAAISKGVTALSTEGTTTIKDNKDNEIKVPKGFGIATDSGINVADGIVIEDAMHEGTTKGSQFVWIPVGTITKTDGSTETITLGRYVFNTSTGAVDESLSKTGPSDQLKTSTSASNYYTEGLINDTTSNTHAKDIATFVSKANSSKGYYIARYEAGIDVSTDQYAYANCSVSETSLTLTYGDSSKMFAKDGSVKPLSIKGNGIWNAVTQGEAATISRNMYNTTNDKVTSDLINSYAWDTAISFIEKCGTNSNYANKTDGNGRLKTAGNNSDEQCKISDMAGNVLEWTTETNSVMGVPCTFRGGSCGDIAYYTAFRIYVTTVVAIEGIGFRPCLYL